MTNYRNFVEFMEQLVIPEQKANPEHIRLDGQLSGGNRNIFGGFQHSGRTWIVHSDTHYKPLPLAYVVAVTAKEPFDENRTAGGGLSLILKPGIKKLQNSSHKYLYIYIDRQ
ncbi:MAG: hypothetical protein AAFY63_14730 [Cyanobacteria bacterium J06643_13]